MIISCCTGVKAFNPKTFQGGMYSSIRVIFEEIFFKQTCYDDMMKYHLL